MNNKINSKQLKIQKKFLNIFYYIKSSNINNNYNNNNNN